MATKEEENMYENTSTKICITLSSYHKEKLVKLTDKFGCSQAEIIRIGLIRMSGEEL
ncbi:hypothetical protein HNV12_20785 [Methanococcoides sp. SA1]|nr:hypothetical protein [Methanococcoides sp. SA1]